MKILIVSDTHRHDENLEIVLNKVSPIDLLIHLGDTEGTEDYIEALSPCPVKMVSGNNDFGSLLPKNLIIKIKNYTVLLTHGHLENVSYSLDNIIKKAKNSNIDIVMFGHTHRPLIAKKEGVLLLNPGSLSYPRQDGRRPTFIIMEVDDSEQLHYTLNDLIF